MSVQCFHCNGFIACWLRFERCFPYAKCNDCSSHYRNYRYLENMIRSFKFLKTGRTGVGGTAASLGDLKTRCWVFLLVIITVILSLLLSWIFLYITFALLLQSLYTLCVMGYLRPLIYKTLCGCAQVHQLLKSRYNDWEGMLY